MGQIKQAYLLVAKASVFLWDKRNTFTKQCLIEFIFFNSQFSIIYLPLRKEPIIMKPLLSFAFTLLLSLSASAKLTFQ